MVSTYVHYSNTTQWYPLYAYYTNSACSRGDYALIGTDAV